MPKIQSATPIDILVRVVKGRHHVRTYYFGTFDEMSQFIFWFGENHTDATNICASFTRNGTVNQTDITLIIGWDGADDAGEYEEE